MKSNYRTNLSVYVYKAFLTELILSDYVSRLIRLTSPNLNYVIVAGALCFYASVYFVLWPEISEDTVIGFCNVSINNFICLYTYI